MFWRCEPAGDDEAEDEWHLNTKSPSPSQLINHKSTKSCSQTIPKSIRHVEVRLVDASIFNFDDIADDDIRHRHDTTRTKSTDSSGCDEAANTLCHSTPTGAQQEQN